MTTSSNIIDYLGYGAAADRPVSLTLSTGAMGLYFAIDSTELSAWDGSTWTLLASGSSVSSVASGFGLAGGPITSTGTLLLAFQNTPQGRLTLQSGVPVMTADQVNKGTIYYDSFVGNLVPVWDGTVTRLLPIASDEISLILDATNNLSTHVYDVFAWSNSGTLTLGAGPAWASGVSRGTGGGTTELQRKNGIWTNKNSITLHNNSVSSGAIAANEATYLGSFYATANAQTGVALNPAPALGGTNNILGLFNAYHRERVVARCADSTPTWDTGSSGSWRALNNSNLNRISWLDGLQESLVDAVLMVQASTTSGVGAVGMSLDSVTATPNVSNQWGGGTATNTGMSVPDRFYPQLGFHYVSAQEVKLSGTAFSLFGIPTAGVQNIALELELST